MESIIIYTVATALTYPFAYWFMREFGTKHFRRVNKRNIFLISVSSILMCGLSVIGLLVETILYRKVDSFQTNICLSVWLICMFLTDILGYFIYFRCLIIEEEKAEINLSLTAYDMQYQALYDKIAEEKRMRHNMRHHFRTIMTLAETGNQEELKEYIGKYLDEWEGFSEKRISRNEMVNAILSYYYTQAEERDIEVISDIELKENYPFDMTDMTVLLGNAMENAIEACGRCQSGRPCISVMMKQLKQVILIKIENSCRSTQSPVMDETGCTSTKEGRRIGYGMKSIDMIAKNIREMWSSGRMETHLHSGSFSISLKKKNTACLISTGADKKEMVKLKLKDGLILREVAGQYVIVPTGKRVQEITSIVYISSSAAYLWDYMKDNEFEKEDLVQRIMEHYTGVTEEQAGEDVEKFLKTLADNNILDDGVIRGSAFVRIPRRE